MPVGLGLAATHEKTSFDNKNLVCICFLVLFGFESYLLWVNVKVSGYAERFLGVGREGK